MYRAAIILTILTSLFAAEPAFAAAPVNDDAVAVVIGNRSYKSERIPAVTYAHNDAAAMKRYLMDVLGYREGNIIHLKDATQAEMQAVFGNRATHKGKLWRFLRKGVSDVTVFYSGHGVPGLKDKRGYLLPVDADPNAPEINGFPMDVLQRNLSQLGARSVAVYIDACFSGDSSAGILIKSASGITVTPRLPRVSKGMVMLTAAKADQVASWDETNKHGLFTYHLLAALYGKADTSRYGDGNGSITVKEVEAYLGREMTYAARREYGREQDASVQGNGATVLGPVPEVAPQLAALPPAKLAIDALDETYVVIKTVNVRATPDAKSKKVTTLRLDAGVQVTGRTKDGKWLRIAHGGNDAFVWSSLIKPIDAAELAAWDRVKESREASAFEGFLSDYQSGHFSGRAKRLLAALTHLPKVGTRQSPPPAREPLASSTSILPKGTPKDQYKYAFGLLRIAEYDKAELALQEFVKLHPKHVLVSNARYWLGEIYYVRAAYVQAAEVFLENYRADPKGAKVPDSLLRLGMSLAGLDKKRAACRAFNKLIKDYPSVSDELRNSVDREKQKNNCS